MQDDIVENVVLEDMQVCMSNTLSPFILMEFFSFCR